MRQIRPQVVSGQVWRDRDPRMYSGNRRVLVISAYPSGFVQYQQVDTRHTKVFDRIFRSSYPRFQRAFEFVGRDEANASD